MCLFPITFSVCWRDAALYAGIGVYSRRAVSRFAGDSAYHHQSVLLEYAGMGLRFPPHHCNQFNAAQVALNAAFLPRIMLSGIYLPDRQYACGDPRGDLYYSGRAICQHPAKSFVSGRQYSVVLGVNVRF